MNAKSTCFARGNDYVARRVAGETIVVPVRGHVADLEAIFTLNEVGTAIWSRLDGCTTVGQIVEDLCREYEVEAEEAGQDTVAFLASLEEAGLIHPAPI